MKEIKFEQAIRCVMPLGEDEYYFLSFWEDERWYDERWYMELDESDGDIMFGADHMELTYHRDSPYLEFITENRESAEVVLKRVQKFLAQGMKNNE